MSLFQGFAARILVPDRQGRHTSSTIKPSFNTTNHATQPDTTHKTRSPSQQQKATSEDAQNLVDRTINPPIPNTEQQTWPGLIPDDFKLDDVAPGFDDSTVLNSLKSGFARSTIKNYESAIRAYTDFIDANNISKDKAFPADEKIICAFTASMYAKKSGQTASGLLSGLKTWHELHDLPWNGGRRQQIILKGIAIAAPKNSHREKRVPITIELMKLLVSSLDLKTGFDAAVWAGASSLFWGQGRSGEFFGTSRLSHKGEIHPSRSSIKWSKNQDSFTIDLPRTKTNRINGQTILLLEQADPLSPIKAMQNHLSINNCLDSDHLFAFQRTENGPTRCLTIEAFLNRCNEIWTRHGHNRITGHSFRIGGTSTMLQNGVSPDIVKEMGRWTSDAFFKYWRDLPSIAAIHASMIETGGTNTPLGLQRNTGGAQETATHLQGVIRQSVQGHRRRMSGAATRSQLPTLRSAPSTTRP
ncbi:site specific recombinase, phage integrase family protein [Ceratobasidium sp. AG-Ba]|nr:site specific recombinase, phage integrase family protein [Ceratobasidium sp. AG-Ba]